MRSFIIVIVMALMFVDTSYAQQPVPSQHNQPSASQEDTGSSMFQGRYPEGANDDDRAFIDAVRKAMDQASLRELGPFRRFTINRRLSSNLDFVREAKVNAGLALIEQNPDLAMGPISWPDIDPEQLRAVLEVIMEFIQFLVELFAHLDYDVERFIAVAGTEPFIFLSQVYSC